MIFSQVSKRNSLESDINRIINTIITSIFTLYGQLTTIVQTNKLVCEVKIRSPTHPSL